MTDDPRDGPIRLPVPPPLTPAMRVVVSPKLADVAPTALECALGATSSADLMERLAKAFPLPDCEFEPPPPKPRGTMPGFDSLGTPCEEFDA